MASSLHILLAGSPHHTNTVRNAFSSFEQEITILLHHEFYRTVMHDLNNIFHINQHNQANNNLNARNNSIEHYDILREQIQNSLYDIKENSKRLVDFYILLTTVSIIYKDKTYPTTFAGILHKNNIIHVGHCTHKIDVNTGTIDIKENYSLRAIKSALIPFVMQDFVL